MANMRHFLFGTPDRAMSTLSLVIGLASLIVSVISYKLPQPSPGFIVVRDLLIVAFLTTSLTVMAIKYYKKYSMAETFRERLSGQLRDSHQLIHKFRDIYFTEIRGPLLSGSITEQEAETISRSYLKKICHSLLMDVREQMLSYFHSRGFELENDLTITMKMIISAREAQTILDGLKGPKADRLSANEKYIITGYRDPITWEKNSKRKEVRKAVYRANDENTAFKALLVEYKDEWHSNNLRSLPGYQNDNPVWRELYNATQLVPIRCKPGETTANIIPYGILAADSGNLAGYELFDNDVTFNILGVAADVLALMFAHLEIIELIGRGGPLQLVLKGVSVNE